MAGVLVSALVALGCGEQPALQTQQQRAGLRSELTRHKVQLPPEQAAALLATGAQVRELADYGSSKLLEVDDPTARSLPASEAITVRDGDNDLLLNAGTIDTASSFGKSLLGLKPAATGRSLQLVQFAGPIKAEWLKALEATGVRVITYIPNNAYLVYGDAVAVNALAQHVASPASAVQWSAAYLDDYKLDPSIESLKTDEYAIQLVEDGEVNAATLAHVASVARRPTVVDHSLGYVNVVAQLSTQDVYSLAAHPDVVSIQARPTPIKMDERQDVILAGQITGTQPTGPGYLAWLASKGLTQAAFSASGFGVDVSDSGLDNGTQLPNHFALYTGGDVTGSSRVIYNRLEGTPNAGSTIQGCDGHGNLNSHIVAGFSNLTGAIDTDAAGFAYDLGMAPFVKVGSSVVFDPGNFTNPDYEDLQARAYQDGMRISTNSWGSSANSYGADSQRYDALVRDAQQSGSAVVTPGNQEMVILFAAGNAGSGANTVGTPGTAKNVITVGASENVRGFAGSDQCSVPDTDANSLYDIVGFSSRGPTSDGRKKPDLMAPGTHVTGGVAQTAGQRAQPPAVSTGQANSCFDGSGVCGGVGSNFFPSGQQWYTASSGTSHSTPAIAGAAALLRQSFINQGMTPPSPAMTKAFLMNTARYMTGTGANDNLYSNNQGMGLLDLGTALDGTGRLLDDENPANLFTATGQTRTFTGVVGASGLPFRVTLAWTDAPGSTTGSAWKNNLDLTVTVGGNTYKGNVFTGANSVTGGAADASNNVESVFLPAGVSGPYTITVTAANINSDGVPGNASALDQDFALVAYNSCTTAPAAITGLTISTPANNEIDLDWTANGAGSYRIYRSLTSGGPYTQVGSVAAPPFADLGVSGGTTYFYVVRGVDCAESPDSTQVSATATGVCTLPPTFAGIASVTNAQASTCGITATWAAATPACGGTLSYSVYRSTTPGFTPSAGTRIASGVTGTSFADDLNLANGTTYYYAVRATETSNAVNEDANTVIKSTKPTGAAIPGVSYFDDFDANRPTNAAAYWIPTTITGTAGTLNLTTNCRYQSSNKSYRWGAANATCGGSYPVSTQAQLSLGGDGTVSGINGFAIPATTQSPTMTFNLWYSTEAQWDGAWLTYSTTSAAGPWTNVTDSASGTAPFISAGGYDNVPRGSLPASRIWTNTNTGANGSLKAVTVDLTALAGQTVWFAFRYYSDITGVAEGVYLDDVRVQAGSFNSCTTNLPPPGPAVGFQITGLGASNAAGVPVTATLTAVDSVGQTATSYNGTAPLSSSDPQATLGSASFTNGVATAPVTFRTIGTQTLTATDSANAAIVGTASTSVTAGPATDLFVLTEPSTTAAGASISPAVRIGLKDQFGNPVGTGTNPVTLSLATNPAGGTLGGSTTVAMVNGVATFSGLSIQKAGAGYGLQADAPGLGSATSASFTILPAAASTLVFGTQPSNLRAGVPINPAVTVEVRDQYGNLTAATDYVTLALGTTPPGGTLLGTTTVAAIAGVATFSDLSVDLIGTGYTLLAGSGGLTPSTSAAFDVAPGSPDHVLFTVQPATTVAGAVLSPAVEARIYDRFGNLEDQSADVTLSFANNPAGGTLSGTLQQPAPAGVAVFNDLAINRAGHNYALQAQVTGLAPVNSQAFDVTVGAPAALVFQTQPASSLVSGAPFDVRVALVDGSGNTVTSPPDLPVTLVLQGAGSAALSGTNVVNTVAGVASFSGLSVDLAGGGYNLQAVTSFYPPASSSSFAVVSGPAVSLAVSLPTPVKLTQPVAITAVAHDAHGNLARDYEGTVTVGSSDPLATGPAQGVFSRGVLQGGTVAFGTAGGQSVTLTDLTSATVAGQGATTVERFADPTVAVTSPADGDQVNGLVTISVAGAVAPGTTVSELLVMVDGVVLARGPQTQLTTVWNSELAAPGSAHLIKAVITDATGTQSQSAPVTVTRPAIAAPTVAVTAPISGSTVTGTVLLTADGAVGAGTTLASLVLKVDGTQVAHGTSGSLAALWDSDQVAPGSAHTVTAEITDGEGTTVASAPVTLTRAAVDAPTVAISAPLDGAVVEGPVQIVASASVGAGTTVRKLTLLVDDVELAGGPQTTLSAVWNSAQAPLGSHHTLLAVIEDAVGNRTVSSPVTLTVKAVTDKPSVAILTPYFESSVSGSVQIIASGAVANGTTVGKLSIAVDGTEIASGAQATLITQWDSSTVTADAKHTLTATLTDSAGNTATSTEVVVTVKRAGGCGCATTSGGEAALYVGLFALLQLGLSRRKQRAAH